MLFGARNARVSAWYQLLCFAAQGLDRDRVALLAAENHAGLAGGTERPAADRRARRSKDQLGLGRHARPVIPAAVTENAAVRRVHAGA